MLIYLTSGTRCDKKTRGCVVIDMHENTVLFFSLSFYLSDVVTDPLPLCGWTIHVVLDKRMCTVNIANDMYKSTIHESYQIS